MKNPKTRAVRSAPYDQILPLVMTSMQAKNEMLTPLQVPTVCAVFLDRADVPK